MGLQLDIQADRKKTSRLPARKLVQGSNPDEIINCIKILTVEMERKYWM